MDNVSKGREHMYRMYGIRAMHGAIAEDAEALRSLRLNVFVFEYFHSLKHVDGDFDTGHASVDLQHGYKFVL